MNTREFIKTLHTGAVEFNNLHSVLSFEQAMTNKTDNIYFLSGLKHSMTTRAKDKDIFTKKYFCIDVDMRNQYVKQKEEDEDITNDDIINQGEEMSIWLKEDAGVLGNWRHIVFSGNGLHIYYEIKPSQYKIKEYSEGVAMIYEMWNEYWGDDLYKADNACKNIGRILRLPGSINQKNGAEVKIIASQDVVSDFNLKELSKKHRAEVIAKTEKEQKERLEEQKKMNRMEELAYGKTKDKKEDVEGFFKKINLIPAYIVSEKLHPEFKFLKNNRNFLSDNPGKGNKFTAFYYSSRLNGIVNGGSSYYNWGESESVWSNSNLVKHELGLTWGETMKWFRSNFNIK